MRLADYCVQFLAERGVKHVFLVTGGGAMHLNDAFGRSKSIGYVACHHEQACAMAAESYFRASGSVAAVNVTTGPGGTNALTGVFGAYVDSCAMLVLSGQVKRETIARLTDLPLRQLGDQEVDIVAMVKPITKYAELITDPQSIRYHLEKAWHECVSGRPGPVWLDIPIDVQAAEIEPDRLSGFSPPLSQPGADLPRLIQSCFERLQRAQRPVILAGAGVRLSGCHEQFIEVAERLGIPVTTGWNAHDAIWNDHPLYCGRPSSVGDRAGNWAVQNSDFLLVLGSRLNVRQVSYNWKAFARAADITMVDVDEAELRKPTLRISHPIHASLQDFFDTARGLAYPGATKAHTEYLAWCRARVATFPVVLAEYRTSSGPVNPYVFMESLFYRLPEDAIVVTGDGTACVASFQAACLRPGQRLYTNSGSAPMGYDLPAAVGAAIAFPGRPIVCLAGDGSIQMNLQELQTIATHRLPIKIFVLNNKGYHSIRQTQQNYFPDNIVGCGEESGLGFPDFEKVAAAYGMPYSKISSPSELPGQIATCISASSSFICEVVLDLQQNFAPKLASRRLADGRMVSSPLEDLWPFLSRSELRENMLIPLVEE